MSENCQRNSAPSSAAHSKVSRVQNQEDYREAEKRMYGSNCLSVSSAAATLKVYHVQLEDIAKHAPEKLEHLQRGGIREGIGRSEAQVQQMLDKIPSSERAGFDSQSAAASVKDYLQDKDASHIIPHSRGGSSHPDNIKWENQATNRARGNQQMTRHDEAMLNVQAQLDNVAGAVKAGLESAPRGAAIGALTTAPFSILSNSLACERGEISTSDAVVKTVAETAVGAGIGAATAFAVTTVAVACPPVAVAIAAATPVLWAVSGVSAAFGLFNIFDDHNQKVARKQAKNRRNRKKRKNAY